MARFEKLQEIFDKLSYLCGVSGRMQRVAKFADNCCVFIDYAHTPDALYKSLDLLKSIKNKGIEVIL